MSKSRLRLLPGAPLYSFDCFALTPHWHGVAVVQLEGGGGVVMPIETWIEPPGGMLRLRNSSTLAAVMQLLLAGVVAEQGPIAVPPTEADTTVIPDGGVRLAEPSVRPEPFVDSLVMTAVSDAGENSTPQVTPPAGCSADTTGQGRR